MEHLKNRVMLTVSFLLVPLVCAGCGNSDDIIDKTFGGPGYDEGNSISQTSDGGFILTGSTESFGNGRSDLWLIKLNNEGDAEWERTFGGSGHDAGEGVIETNDKGFLIVGRTQPFSGGDRDIWLIKTNSEGYEEWNMEYGGKGSDEGSHIVQAVNGNFFIAGSKSKGTSEDIGDSDILLMKVDNMGRVIWEKTYDGNEYLSDDFGITVKVLDNGGLILVGVLNTLQPNKIQGLIVRLDEDGELLWERQIDGIYPRDLFIESDSRFIISGDLNDDLFILELNDYGETQNLVVRRQDSRERGGYIWMTDEKEYLQAGSTDGSGNGKFDALVVKLDFLGNAVWEKSFGGTERDEIKSGVLTESGYLALTGYTESKGSGKRDLWFLKMPIK